VQIPGVGALALDSLVFDLNGTLTNRGQLIQGVPDRLRALRERLRIVIASADTFGSLDRLAAEHGLEARKVDSGADKRELVRQLGADTCAVVGNGVNDVPALEVAALGIAIVGPEGAASQAVQAANIVCTSIVDALDLLLEPRTIVATLRP
jgi:P-type E1-E2 ATPase